MSDKTRITDSELELAAETSWDSAPVRTMHTVVERGWLSADEAKAELDEYERVASAVSFSSFLVERGLLTLDQVADLEDVAGPEAERRAVEPGEVFSGCVIVKKLGQGGMGTVYLATRESDDAAVVVKFLLPAHVNNRAWRMRFLREAMVARRIHHPNVVRVFDVEVKGQQPHIVMELVSGKDLEEQLEESGPVAPLEAARIGRDVARGLAAAHAVGVIHRDVKPGNIRLTAEGEVKILDFGLAKFVETDDGVSLAGQVLGTPWYMAPEQWGEHMVDARSDQFSLGASLYHLVTGEPPFAGKRPMTIYRKAVAGRCPPPSEVRPGCPTALDLAILRMLAVDRRARFASVSDCEAALQSVLDGGQVSVPSLIGLKDGAIHPLVPATTYVLGRSLDSQVHLDDPGTSRSHARIRFGPTGFQLLDLGSSYGTFVNEMKVQEVLLKSGDVIRCGHTELRFHDGGLGSEQRVAGPRGEEGRLQVSTLPEPFMDYLVDSEDKRVVIALLERLPQESIDARVESSRHLLRELYGGEVAEKAGTALRDRLHKRRSDADRHLFNITFENHRGECGAWLAWWDEQHDAYPPQLGPQRLRPRIRLRVVAGVPPKAYELTERLRTTLGRSAANDILLQDRSISRQHATVLRLHQRLMIRDDGSRFGTRLGEEPVASAFLSPGDRISLGKVDLACEAEDLIANPPRTKQGLVLVDPHLFEALCEQNHPAVIYALYRFLPFTQELDWVDREAAKLFDGSDKVKACSSAVRAAYEAHAARARELLPRLVPALSTAPDWRAWPPILAQQELPPQVLPVGWFQPTC